jgi:hypothetical protein
MDDPRGWRCDACLATVTSWTRRAVAGGSCSRGYCALAWPTCCRPGRTGPARDPPSTLPRWSVSCFGCPASPTIIRTSLRSMSTRSFPARTASRPWTFGSSRPPAAAVGPVPAPPLVDVVRQCSWTRSALAAPRSRGTAARRPGTDRPDRTLRPQPDRHPPRPERAEGTRDRPRHRIACARRDDHRAARPHALRTAPAVRHALLEDRRRHHTRV